MDIDMHRVHVCTTENISVVLKMRLTKMEMQKRTNKKTSSNNNKAEHTAEKRKKTHRIAYISLSSIHVSSQNYLLLVLCFYSLFHRHTLPMSWKSISWKGPQKFIEIQGDTKTVHRNGTLIIMSLSVSEFCVCVIRSVMWSECVCILYYLMNIEWMQIFLDYI